MTEQLTAADVLERAADKLEQPGAWTQSAWARNADGEPVGPNDSDAKCWCLRGALAAASGCSSGAYGPAADLVDRIVPMPVHWNDRPDRKQSEVVQALREAAALARSEAAQ